MHCYILTPECMRLRLELLVRLVTENYQVIATKSNSKYHMLPSEALTHVVTCSGISLNISGNFFVYRKM